MAPCFIIPVHYLCLFVCLRRPPTVMKLGFYFVIVLCFFYISVSFSSGMIDLYCFFFGEGIVRSESKFKTKKREWSKTSPTKKICVFVFGLFWRESVVN